MQKLVNINSLRDRFNVAERCEDCGRDGRYCDGGLYGYEGYTARDICEILDDEPEIKAIPIEWLQRRRDIYLKAYHAGHESEIHTAAILNDTLMAWLKEHGEKENEENTDN